MSERPDANYITGRDLPPRDQQLDPYRTEVFVRGPDGRLHPISGWKTTGPFDVGAWNRNIDWPGVAMDAGSIALGAAAFSPPGLATGFGRYLAAGALYGMAEDTLEDLNKVRQTGGR